MALTPKQEQYAQGLYAGLSQRQAYRAAYNAERMSDRVVDNKASALYAKGEVRIRLRELADESTGAIRWNREIATREIMEVRRIALRVVKGAYLEGELSPSAATRFLEVSTAELNRMHRVHEDGTGNGKQIIIIDDF